MNARDRVLRYLSRGEILSGLADCHVPGLYSLVFEPRRSAERGMLRLFYVGPGPNRLNSLYAGEDFALLPHNHRQDITLHGLFGKAINMRAIFEEAAPLRYRYAFGSALLNGKFTLQQAGTSNFFPHAEPIYNAGPGLFLPAQVVHTVVAQSETAWIVEEGRESDQPSFCFSRRRDLALNSEGLYRPLDAAALRAIADQILGRVLVAP